MSTEYLSVRHTAGKTVYFRIFDPSQGAGVNLYTWDFNDDQWETTLAGATTPKLAAVEKTDAGDGQDSLYIGSYDFSNINSTATPKEIIIQAVDDLATDEVITEWSCNVVAGMILDDANVTLWKGAAVGIDFEMEQEAIRQGYRPGRDQIVQWAAAAADRGVNLAAAHDAAVAETPTSTDWVTVFLPPWWYTIAAGDDWDTDYIHYRALFPEMGGSRRPTDLDNYDGTTSLTSFRPPRTVVECSTNDTTTIEQSTTIMRMTGFAIAQLSGDSTGSYHALSVTCDNDPSHYDRIYFWHKAPEIDDRFPVAFSGHVGGLWEHCIANAGAWRVERDTADTQFKATMFDCEMGASSCGGDYTGAVGNHKMTNALLVRCVARGLFTYYSGITVPNGGHSFSGCGSWSIPIDDTCVFIDLEAGDKSYAVGVKNEALQIRCRGGDYCCGSTSSNSYAGEFAGVDIGSIYGKGSLGGRAAGKTGGKLTGICRGSQVTGSELPHRLEGATLDGVHFEVATASQDGLTLLDSNSRVTNSTILAGAGGIPINAGSALNVVASGNRYNEGSTDADGLGPNVTNIAGQEPGSLTSAERTAVVDEWETQSQADPTGFHVNFMECGGSAVAAGAIPNAAADAAGGLPISDAGELDLDAKLANTNEVTAARMGALTDWINDGRLDLLLDAILADTNELQISHALGGTINNLIGAILLDTDTTLPATLATAQADLDTLTGADGVTLATAQANYAPAKAGDAMDITAAGKAGHKMAADGLDSVTTTEPTAKPTNFREWIMWLVQRFRRSKMNRTTGTITVETETGVAVTEQTFSDDGTTQEMGPPS